jgi:ribosomal protein S18 acetylase RimI-like enzyme
MSSPPFRLEPLGSDHNRGEFDCGEAALDRYPRTQATQDMRRNVANCFVAVEIARGRVAAYYAISAASIPLTDLSVEETKRLPRYPVLPAVRIGRLAVDRNFHRRGLGSALLADAAARALQAGLAAFALLVDAKNEAAMEFYRSHGFRSLGSLPRTLFLPLGTAEKARG